MVINCAGEGRRLGVGKTKALVSVLGRPIIDWHMRMLRDVEDVVVVVGHQAHEVVEAVSPWRSDVIFAINHAYSTTGTAASLALGCAGAQGDVISLDGDLLVDPAYFAGFLAEDTPPCLGVAPRTTTDAVLVEISGVGEHRTANSFSYETGGLEWTGLLRVPAELVLEAHDRHATSGHVFEMLSPHLPLAVRDVNAREIDTADDYDRAVEWIGPIADHWAA
ncbi:MAG: NTP transferase domain-containing protein [Solirubrobacteraceae bacterium]